MVINVAPIDESDDDSDDEVDLKLEQATKRRKSVELLLEFDRMDAANRPGKGYITGGGQRSLNIIPPLNDAIYELCMRSPSKCKDSIGFNNLEFNHLLGFFEAALEEAGAIKTAHGHFRSCKANAANRLFILLYTLYSNVSLRRAEGIFFGAKSSIDRDVVHCAKVLLKVLKDQMKSLWPSREVRDLHRTFLPESLQGSGICFLYDSTKLTCWGSQDQDTIGLNTNAWKLWSFCYDYK